MQRIVELQDPARQSEQLCNDKMYSSNRSWEVTRQSSKHGQVLHRVRAGVKEYKRTADNSTFIDPGGLLMERSSRQSLLGFLTNILRLQLLVNLSRTTPSKYTHSHLVVNLEEVLQTNTFLILSFEFFLLSNNSTQRSNSFEYSLYLHSP